MHELSIAESIVKTVIKEAGKRNAIKVSKVGLKIGALTDIVNDALEFGFQAIIPGTILENAKLNIENIPLICLCKKCQKKYEIEQFLFVCPICNGRDLEIQSGNELDIVYIDLEYDDD